jgi:hypothetical protein
LNYFSTSGHPHWLKFGTQIALGEYNISAKNHLNQLGTDGDISIFTFLPLSNTYHIDLTVNQVLCHVQANGAWEEWSQSTGLIVDTYHYANHKRTDLLCQRYCNPQPTDGSDPNLMERRVGNDGMDHWVRCFNTQVCAHFFKGLRGTFS